RQARFAGARRSRRCASRLPARLSLAIGSSPEPGGGQQLSPHRRPSFGLRRLGDLTRALAYAAARQVPRRPQQETEEQRRQRVERINRQISDFISGEPRNRREPETEFSL